MPLNFAGQDEMIGRCLYSVSQRSGSPAGQESRLVVRFPPAHVTRRVVLPKGCSLSILAGFGAGNEAPIGIDVLSEAKSL